MHLYQPILFAGCPYIMNKKNLGHPVGKFFFCIKQFLNTSEEKSIFFRGHFQQEVLENLKFLWVRADPPSPDQNRVNHNFVTKLKTNCLAQQQLKCILTNCFFQVAALKYKCLLISDDTTVEDVIRYFIF